jgi:hypothetical protein
MPSGSESASRVRCAASTCAVSAFDRFRTAAHRAIAVGVLAVLAGSAAVFLTASVPRTK